MELVYFLLIGAAAGWLAGQFMKGKGFGVLGNIVVGILGGILGGFLFGLLGIGTEGGIVGALITAFVGAVVLLLLLGMTRKGKR